MTKTINIDEVADSLQAAIALTKNGDEVVVEENGEPVAKVTHMEKPRQIKERVFGLGEGKVWMSEDFDDELPDEFWGFDKEL
jgi:antitoxin (DNA-binding transcriptional repressor) of toxin-antitoxin stability system